MTNRYEDDPRFTAYVMGELDDAERAELESLLSEFAEARALIEAIERTVQQVEGALGEEPTEGLDPVQRAHVMTRAEAAAPARTRPAFLWAGAAAAGIFLALVLPVRLYNASSDRAMRIDTPAAPRPPGAPPEPEPVAPPTSTGVERVGRSREVSPPIGSSARRRLSPPTYLDDREAPQMPEIVGGVVGGLGHQPPTERVPQFQAPSRGTIEDLGYLSGLETLALYSRDVRPRVLNTERYDRFDDNSFRSVEDHPLSTFSIDVDTASYANVRRFLNRTQTPPRDAVRIEELINYFDYDYPEPSDGQPFSVHVEIADAPWRPEHRLVRLGLKGESLRLEERPSLNLVFLLDVSGSMNDVNKLPLLKRGMKMLVEELTEDDHVTIVVYAGASGLALPRTSGAQRARILDALDRLRAGGSTNGGAGIQLAYDEARRHFVPGGTNRVVLATDGDFNVGVTSHGELTRLIEEQARSGVFLSVLGFGMGNYNDSTLEQLADRGNGNYAYIDTLAEARKVLVREMGATMVTIAKDVKIQVELNPAKVDSYRLLGYENRVLQAEDFNDDRKDAGEIGAGHTVTALYEIVPAGSGSGTPAVDPLKYQPERRSPDQRLGDVSHELLTVKLRYKDPGGDSSRLLEHPVVDSGAGYRDASDDFKFAASVAAFGMILRDSPNVGNATLSSVIELARDGAGPDRHGYRAEFIDLVERARRLRRR